MKKRKVPIALIVGIALVFVGFSYMLGLAVRVHIGSNRSRATVTSIEDILPDKSSGVPGTYPYVGMPVLEINGIDYVAMLEIPAHGVTLPVADTWTDKLYDSPARFCGSSYDNSLVIGGGDYSHQFSFCDKIDNGTIVTVTDMTGAQFTYSVARVDRSKDASGSWLANEDYDLTLFCRDVYSMEYIAVRCKFK